QEAEVAHTAAKALPALADRGQVYVVLHADAPAELIEQLLDQTLAGPPPPRPPPAARLPPFPAPARPPSSSSSFSTRPWRLQPGRFGARMTAPRVGSYTPGVPTVVWMTWAQPMPASAARPRAIAPIWLVSVRALEALARSSRRATIWPVMSASAARTRRRPTSMPATQPAAGFSS